MTSEAQGSGSPFGTRLREDGRRDIGGFRQMLESFEGTPFSRKPRKRGGEDVDPGGETAGGVPQPL